MGGWLRAAASVARELVGLPRPMTLELQPLQTFDTAPRPVDRVIAAMREGSGAVTRELALSVAAVQRGRNELCSLATLPVRLYRGLEPVDAPLFRQFDPDVANVVHMARTIEDLALESVAWWQVTGQDFEQYPVSVKRIDPARVSLRRPKGTAQPDDDRWVWIDHADGKGWRQWPASLMIRFDSPNPGILKCNGRAVRVAARLDGLIEMYATNPALREYFTDADDATDPMDEDDVDDFLAEYGAMRQLRPYAWIPSTVKRADVSTPSPRDLTLNDLYTTVMTQIANGLGVDPEDIGVSTTSRTYQNEDARRRDKINRMYGPYMSAITDRLSMGDVTRRGYTVRFDLSDYLKPDPAGLIAYWEGLKRLGVVDEQWIAGQAGIPTAVTQRAVAAAPATPAAAPAASAGTPAARFDVRAGHTFDDRPAFTFDRSDFADVPAPTVDQAARTITGLAVPYGRVANKYGLKYSFRPGSLEYSSPERLAHLKDHGTPVGFHRSVKDSPDGPVVELAVLDGPEGSPAKLERDQLLYDAAHGLYSGLSIGVDFSIDPEDGDVEIDDQGVYNVVRATWRETSTTYMPAFDDARVTKVAAARTGGHPMDPCQHCGHRHAPNIACATFAAQLRTQPTPAPAPNPVPPQPTGPGGPPPPQPDQSAAFAAFTAWHHAQNAPSAAAFGPTAVQMPPAGTFGPTPVSPHHGPAEVREPSPYVFDSRGNLRAGSHDFSSDLLAGWKHGDQAAKDRAETFVREHFAVTPANVAALNPNRQRPDMYVDQLDYASPIWEAVDKGTLTDMTPFVVPKFATGTSLVADHVTGTEPTAGAFTATSQTITPTAVSGKVEITREAFDQGGNPQMSGLIWRQMQRGYSEALEAYAVAQLVALAGSITDLTITTNAVDSALDQAVSAALIPLKFIRGGDRFRRVFTQVDLYTRLATAKDSAGRRLYPAYGPQNASGTAEPSYDTIDAHGKLWIPAWATAASSANASSSYMFNPEAVCGWASAPQRIDLQWRVAWVDLGIWGYKAFAITDLTQVREIVYDPTT